LPDFVGSDRPVFFLIRSDDGKHKNEPYPTWRSRQRVMQPGRFASAYLITVLQFQSSIRTTIQ
jgi:hypothetical protein